MLLKSPRVFYLNSHSKTTLNSSRVHGCFSFKKNCSPFLRDLWCSRGLWRCDCCHCRWPFDPTMSFWTTSEKCYLYASFAELQCHRTFIGALIFWRYHTRSPSPIPTQPLGKCVIGLSLILSFPCMRQMAWSLREKIREVNHE